MTAPKLDDLLNDGRLARLFSQDNRHCAFQLWVLQVVSDQAIENRVLYARLVPYGYSRGIWSGSDDDSFSAFAEHRAQVFRLSLYVRSPLCSAIMKALAAGETVAQISEKLGLGLSDDLKARFGATALPADDLVYRPVAYLLNRDAHALKGISSPHGAAGAISAAVVRADKDALFRLGDYSPALTRFAVSQLNADTGLDFGGRDAARFGDLELMVFPTLDDAEKSLLHVRWDLDPLALIARFDPRQVPHYSAFQFRLSIVNGGQVAYSAIAPAARNECGILEGRFEIDEELRLRTDSTELEIYGSHDADAREGMLCCRWRVSYVREIHIHGNMIGNGSSPVKFDWLEKTVRPASSSRGKAARTLNRGGRGFESRVGGRDADPWVPVYRELQSLFERLHPPKSEGKFFLRWTKGDPEARLQFVEWFRALLTKYPQHQVVIFDPYFEDAGLGLLLLCALPTADYIVFRSLPKPPKEGCASEAADEPARTGVDNLVASCELNKEMLSRLKLRLYGMRDGRLHDRYILIMAPDGLPIAGFHLSNSLQKAAENYPLLITPIPQDVLFQVERYKSDLVREASEGAVDEGDENSSMRLLFDAAAVSKPPRYFEPPRFLEETNAGDVLSTWGGDPSLKGLSGDPLRERMAALGLLKDQSLALPEATELRHFIDLQAGDFTNFTPTWEVLGELLAHSRAGDTRLESVSSCSNFLTFLIHFLERSFDRAHSATSKEIAVVEARFFRGELDTFLHGSYRPEHLFHATKYTALSWPEFFAVKLLWWYSPKALVALAKAEMLKVPQESQDPQNTDVMRLSLLSQIVSAISLSVQFKIDQSQLDALNHSGNGALRWMGLNALNRALETTDGFAASLQVVDTFSYPDQVKALGWMINKAARDPKTAQIYTNLVAAIHRALPTPLLKSDLELLVDAMRGHMRQLSWAEPWLYRDVVSPLLENGRAAPDDACEIWVQEVLGWLKEDQSHRGHFQVNREGQTINVAAFLAARSSARRRAPKIRAVQSVLKRQQRVLHQPLASTSNWTQWNNALVTSMQVLAFARWTQYYLHAEGTEDDSVEKLTQAASDLALIRPMDEWRAMGGELALFLDKADELLAATAKENEGLRDQRNSSTS